MYSLRLARKPYPNAAKFFTCFFVSLAEGEKQMS